MDGVIDIPAELRGAPKALYEAVANYRGDKAVREYMLVGGGGTGKSFGIGIVLRWLAETYPGIRILVLRKTRRSLTESFCKTWEKDVLLSDDPCLQGGSRTNRHSYTIRPEGWYGNPSEVVLGGLDEPGNLFSTDYDVVYVQQAEQIDLGTWAKFRRALRNFGHPDLRLQLLIADVNPAEPTHWLRARADRGHIAELLSLHKDNPRWWDNVKGEWTEEGNAYVKSLAEMPEGPDKDRLYYSRWSARAGLVWRTYSAATHIIKAPHRAPSWFMGSMDWGTQHPGVLQIWGVDGDNTAYRVREYYARNRSLDWWADKLVECYDAFQPMRCVMADPSRPDAIGHMNMRLGAHVKSRSLPHMVRGADNSKTRSGHGDLSGLDLVRVRLHERKLFLIEGALCERDESLVGDGVPWCSEMEFPQYCYDLDDEGRPIGENTDKDCADHGMDCVRYSQNYIWGRDLSEPPPPKRFAPGSLGQILGHESILARMSN